MFNNINGAAKLSRLQGMMKATFVSVSMETLCLLKVYFHGCLMAPSLLFKFVTYQYSEIFLNGVPD